MVNGEMSELEMLVEFLEAEKGIIEAKYVYRKRKPTEHDSSRISMYNRVIEIFNLLDEYEPKKIDIKGEEKNEK